MRCSRKWAIPEVPGGSSAEPTLYQLMWVTTGVRRSGMTTTSSPLARVKWEALGVGSAAAGSADQNAAASATARRGRVRSLLIGTGESLVDAPTRIPVLARTGGEMP